MQRKLFAIAICALAAWPGSAPAVQKLQGDVNSAGSRVITVSAHGDGPVVEHLTLGRHKAAIVQLDTDSRDVLVSDPKVLEAVVKTPRRIFLLGTETGQASAYFFNAAGRQILTLDVRVERDVAELTRIIHANMPDANVKVTALNDDLVLTGSVANSVESTRAYELALRYAVDPGQSVDPSKVENMLTVKGREQVMLKVRVSEMAHTISKQFGVNLSSAFTAAGIPILLQTANPYGLIGTALSAGSGAQIGNVGSPPGTGPNNVQGILNALDQVGLSHTLAEPNLTAVSGETAKFLAGGSFPVPVSHDQYGNVSIAFKDFGVGLSFTPVVVSESRISLQISTEVSELTNTGAFQQPGQVVNGQVVGALTIPALAVRRAETTVELPSGGSFAIAGLLQHTNKQVIDAFPGLKDMPVLGALFRSRDYQNNETELVVIVSAYIVDPTHETKLAGPTDGFVPASDPQTVLFGNLNDTYKNDPHGLKSARDDKVGFIVE